MRFVLFVLLLILALGAAPAFSKVNSSTVHYMSGKDTVSSILFIPAGKGPFPAIIVIHEWWGLNDWVKKNASELASRGYVTLGVDLYRGRVAADPELAHELMRGLPEDRAARDLVAASAYLKSRAEVNPRKIGSIGWCMGGGYSLAAAPSPTRPHWQKSPVRFSACSARRIRESLPRAFAGLRLRQRIQEKMFPSPSIRAPATDS